MLSIQNDFSHFDRIDWARQFEVNIRFLVELLAHTYGKKPEQIIEALCLCNEALPTLRYEEEEFDDSSDPQWMLFRYHTVLHTKALLSNTLESSAWGLVQSKSLSCREEIKYKSETYPSASNEEIIFQSEGPEANGVGSVMRMVTPPRDVPLEECWASRQEIEDYLAHVPAFSGWLAQLPELTVASDVSATSEKEPLQWLLKKAGGNKWQCGPENNPVWIYAYDALTDLRYAINYEGENCSHLEYLAQDEKQVEIAQSLKFSTSSDALTPQTLRELDNAIEQLETKLESAKDSGNIEEFENFDEQLKQILEYRKKNTMPGGKSRKMTEGDPSFNAMKAMRGRRDTLVEKLESVGLNEMAIHIRDYFDIQPKTFAYNRGPPYPKWVL